MEKCKYGKNIMRLRAENSNDKYSAYLLQYAWAEIVPHIYLHVYLSGIMKPSN